MILAAGLGTRLDPLTRLRAKPAVPFLGQPLVRRLARQLLSAERIVVNLHHRPETVRAALEGLPVHFSPEAELLGTAGGLGQALRDGLIESDEPVLVVNGKLHTDLPFEALWRAHQASGAAVTMALFENWAREAFREVRVEGDRVVGFEEGRSPVSERPLAFTGVQVLSPRVLGTLQPVFSDTVRDVFPPLVAAGEVAAWISDARWWEFSTCERYLGLHLRARRLGMRDDSEIDAESVAWPGARVPSQASLRRCVVLEEASVPEGRHEHLVFGPDGPHPLDPAAVRRAEGDEGPRASSHLDRSLDSKS